MKYLFFCLLWIGSVSLADAQTRTSDYYIQISVNSSSSGFQAYQPDLEMPELKTPQDSLVNQAALKSILKKGNILDVLNYFSREGWQLVNTTAVPYGDKDDVTTRVYYLLKKNHRPNPITNL